MTYGAKDLISLLVVYMVLQVLGTASTNGSHCVYVGLEARKSSLNFLDCIEFSVYQCLLSNQFPQYFAFSLCGFICFVCRRIPVNSFLDAY